MTAPLTSLSFIDLVTQSGLVAKSVLIILLLASLGCWTLIFERGKILRLAIQQNKKFLETFWSGKTLDEVAEKCHQFPSSPIAQVFHQGIQEIKKLPLQENGYPIPDSLENLQRTLWRTAQTRLSELEKYLTILATTASAAPFVGLFGTVWGIMNAFQNIGVTGNAQLASVAPGISEALITTAMGIATAIPAAISYNFFLSHIKKINIDLDCFNHDFLNLCSRRFKFQNKGTLP